MKLYATLTSKSSSINVYDDEGRAVITRLESNGSVCTWRSPDRTAEEWVSINVYDDEGRAVTTKIALFMLNHRLVPEAFEPQCTVKPFDPREQELG